MGEQAGPAGSQALGQAQELAHEARERGASLVGAAGERLASTAQARKETLAERLEDVAQAVHRSGEQLEGHQDWIASLVKRGAGELSTLAGKLRTNDLQGLMGSLQDFGRRQLARFAGASLAAGFALAWVVAVAGASRADLPKLPKVIRERQ